MAEEVDKQVEKLKLLGSALTKERQVTLDKLLGEFDDVLDTNRPFLHATSGRHHMLFPFFFPNNIRKVPN